MWLIKKIHTYAGLLTFVNLMVYGIVGLSALYLLRPHPQLPAVGYRSFTVDTKIQTSTIGLFTTLAWMHIAQGVWAYVAILFSLGLLTLGATGIYLWFKNHNERWIGAALLLAGAGIAVGLIVSMRLG
jgi:hypothetical protein